MKHKILYLSCFLLMLFRVMLPHYAWASYGAIPGLTSESLYGVYYGDFDDALIDDITGGAGHPKYDLIIVHPDSNITPADIARLKAAGTKVYCYLSIGEDDTLHTSKMTGGVSGPAPGYATWYYDANKNRKPDPNGAWGSYYVNVSDLNWHKALKTYTNTGTQGWYGYDYAMNTLGCSGLFLDTVDTVTPRAWGGKYAAQLGDMVNLIAEIRANIPADRSLIINRGLFYFDGYNSVTNPYGLKEITPSMKDTIRKQISGILFENFMSEWQRNDWGPRLNTEAVKADGFNVFTLDYLPVDVPVVCDSTQKQWGWIPYVSDDSLGTFHNEVRDQCGY